MRAKTALMGVLKAVGKTPGALTLGLGGVEAGSKGKNYYRQLQDPQRKSRALGGAAPGAVPMKKVSEVLREKLEKQAAPVSPEMIGKALALGGGIALTSKGIDAAGEGVGSLHTKFRAMRMFNELKSRHKSVASNPKAREYFDLIVAYAPSLLRHRAAVGDFLLRQLEYPSSSIEFIKQLADLEKTVAGTPAPGAGFGQSVIRHGAPALMGD